MVHTPLAYSHRQYGKTILMVFIAVLLVCFFMALGLEWHPALLIPIFIILFAGFIFSSLTVKVSDKELIWYFGPGLWVYRLALNEISSVQTVRNKWWYGFGVRVTPHGWLFNVDGLDAIEVTTKDGIKRRLGTNQPEQLLNIIKSNI